MARKTHKSPEEARNAILDAAEKVILEVGPAGLRISAVAKKASMAHPNIIHHFGSRDGLISAVADRLGKRATQRITTAIRKAVNTEDPNKVNALTHVLDTAYPGDEGKLAVWLHLSGMGTSLKDNMQSVLEVSHELRKSISDDAKKVDTSRLVMLITLALIGEVVSGEGMKEALGFGTDDKSRAHFREWLAALVLDLDDKTLSLHESQSAGVRPE